ncbi:hypothetical protein RHGRI_025958 [Rhododendron griersonianum]|uniref:Aminotransferase-like plant mobile domain-containing protein n=1 Tax=Rhododendron griersonianum TaxID=479676 RepID=A0AAV6IRV4_9ERIC|nr:hypothetical protein RHGRI_025958 [Rhododendron griersonianum]
MMVRDDVEQGSKAVLQTSIRELPAGEWRRTPYLGGSTDSFWRKAEAFVPETDITGEPLSLVPEVSPEEADLIPPCSVLRFRVERGDIPSCFVNYEAVSQAPVHWGDWVEAVLGNPESVHILRSSRALEPIRLSVELSIRRNNANVDLMVSRWSKDTHTFVFPWGDGGPTLQDTAVLMRLSTRGSVAFDPSNLSSADARLVDRLRRAYTEAGKHGSRFDREGRVRAPPKSGKTSWGCWLRYFFKDLPPPGTEPPVEQAAEFYGKMYDSDLHLAGFLVYWLSFFVIPDFPYEGPNQTVFPLARGDFVPLGPLFLGSLFHRLDQVHTDTERSMGRYDLVSVVHTQFLMAFCFEHLPSLAPSAADLSWSEEPRPRIMRWSGASSTKSWGKRVDDASCFLPRPYAEPIEGTLPTSFFSEDDRIVDFQTDGVAVPTSCLSAFAAACPCSLPAFCAEGPRAVLYRPDRVARQFGYDQGAPGPAPPLRSFVESLRRFTRAFVAELSEGYTILVLPRNGRETFFTANNRLAWRRNLDSFINYVRGVPVIPAMSVVYHRDISLRSPKARQPGWRDKSTYWATSGTTPTPAASRGITIAEPISAVLPTRVTRAKAKEQASLQQGDLRLKRLRKGPPVRFTRTSRSEETPASVASAGSSFRYKGGEHTPLSKLKRKREGEEAREEGSDSSIDDTVPISQSFKQLRTTHLSPGGTSAAAGKKVVIVLEEGEPDGDESDANGSDDRDDEEDDGSSAGGSEGNQSDEDDDDGDYSGDGNGDEDLVHNEGEDLGSGGDNDDDGDEGRGGSGGDDGNLSGDVMPPVIDEDEEDANIPDLVPRRRVLTEGILSVPDINQLAPEADIPPPSSQEAVKTALHLLDKRINIPPTGDLTSHFQAHDAAVALTNLTTAEVFADLQDDSLVSLGLSQTGYAAGHVGAGTSLQASDSVSQQQAEASTSREHAAVEEDAEVQVVDPPAVNEVEEPSNEDFFGYYGFTPESTSFLSFVRDLFPYTFFKVRGLYSRTMGRMQLECLYTFLWNIKDTKVYDLGPYQIEEIGLTVQNFDKLGFDIWWVYKELEAAKIMRENEKLRMDCEGAKVALEKARVALAEAQSAVTAAEAAVEERRLAYERLAEEARLGDRLVDAPLRDTDPFLRNIFGA